jgi:hypothetical protein
VKLGFTAAAALKGALRRSRSVTNVGLGGGRQITIDRATTVFEIVLEVFTLRQSVRPLRAIPDDYAGFLVREVNLAPVRKAYLNTWKRLFKELKGWNEQRTMEWAQQWEAGLTGRGISRVYRDGPVKAAFNGLIENEVRVCAGKQYYQLRSAMLDTLLSSNGVSQSLDYHPDLDNGYDWALARRRFKELMAQFGASSSK